MAKKPRYCWDTSVFLAWFKEEPVSKTPTILAVIDEITRKEAALVVPVLVYTEVLEAKHTPATMETFRKFLKRSNVTIVNIAMALAEKAEVIRTKGLREKPKRKIKTPDALFIACAIMAEVDMLHSLDPDMLNLNGSATVDKIRICQPRTLDDKQLLC